MSLKRNFPSFIEAFLDYTKHVGAPDKFLLWSALSGIAGCLERRTWIIYNKTQTIYPNIFTMLIAESGIANKSTSSKPIMELLYEVEGLRFMAAQMSAAALVKQLHEAGEGRKFEYASEVYKNSSLFSYSSEAKVTLGDAKGVNGIQELLTDFYDCGDPSVWSNKKGWTKTLVGTGTTTIFNPCLNVLYCSTPTWLVEALGKSGIEGGFASRCFFVYQKERHIGNIEWLEDDEIGESGADKNQRKKLIEDLTQISKMQGEYRTAKGFKDVYNTILKERNQMIDGEHNKQMKPYYTRKMWHLLKLSQILAADRSNELIIRPEYLEYANELLKMIEPTMYEAFGVRGENQLAVQLGKVWEILRKKPAFTKQELIRVAWSHANLKNIDEMVAALSAFGKIIPEYSAGKTNYRIIDPTPLQ